jgi:hypothetical protein
MDPPEERPYPNWGLIYIGRSTRAFDLQYKIGFTSRPIAFRAKELGIRILRIFPGGVHEEHAVHHALAKQARSADRNRSPHYDWYAPIPHVLQFIELSIEEKWRLLMLTKDYEVVRRDYLWAARHGQIVEEVRS